MVAFTTRMPAGIPGSISRSDSKTVEPGLFESGYVPALFGRFVKLTAGLYRDLATSDAGSVVAGFLVRSYPMQSTDNNFGAGAPPNTTLTFDVLKRGYAIATLKLGTAVKGGQVYVVTTAGGSVAVGDIVTSASPAGGGTGVAVPNAFFTGPADAGGIVEIAYNI